MSSQGVASETWWRRFFRRATAFVETMEVTEYELLERRIALLEQQVRRLEALALAALSRGRSKTPVPLDKG